MGTVKKAATVPDTISNAKLISWTVIIGYFIEY